MTRKQNTLGQIASAAAGIGLVIALPVGAQPSNADLAKRSPAIHWPAGFTPESADLFAHNEIFIQAPCATVWQRLVEAPKWPAWYPNAQNVRILEGGSDFRHDSQFAFDTFGLHIEARIGEFVPASRLGWFGNGDGIQAYHTWLMREADGGCQVVTEESAKGPGAVALRSPDPDAMHKGHDLWLDRLKRVSEQ
jgi:hypothetical protein